MNHWLAVLCAPLLAGEPTKGAPIPVQRGPEVSGAVHDSSPPLREIPPAPSQPGKRVHPVKRIPRPAPKPDGGPQ